MGLHQFARQKFSAVLEKHHIDDDALLDDLLAAGWEVRSFQPPALEVQFHPALALYHKLTGRHVPDVLRAELIQLYDETPDPELWHAAWADWNRGGRDPKACTWWKWPRAKKTGRVKQAPARPAPNFAAGYDVLFALADGVNNGD